MRNIVPQKREERNIVHLMPHNTAMGWLQRNRPDLLTKSGAIDGSLRPYACQVAHETTKFLKEAIPEDYR